DQCFFERNGVAPALQYGARRQRLLGCNPGPCCGSIVFERGLEAVHGLGGKGFCAGGRPGPVFLLDPRKTCAGGLSGLRRGFGFHRRNRNIDDPKVLQTICGWHDGEQGSRRRVAGDDLGLENPADQFRKWTSAIAPNGADARVVLVLRTRGEFGDFSRLQRLLAAMGLGHHAKCFSLCGWGQSQYLSRERFLHLLRRAIPLAERLDQGLEGWACPLADIGDGQARRILGPLSADKQGAFGKWAAEPSIQRLDGVDRESVTKGLPRKAI